MAAFHERHAANPEDAAEPDEDEAEAGLEELADRFGVLLTLDTLAASLRLTRWELLEKPADTDFTQLALEQAKAAFQRRLSKIHREKTK